MKCALYARVSTEEQAKRFSISAQVDLLRNFARTHKYEIFKEYVDEGASGSTSDRSQLKELLSDAQRGFFEIVLVYRIDRFSRNTRELLNTMETLKKIGVSLRSITEPFDTAVPLENFAILVLGSIAQLERDTLIERAKMGTLRSVKEGHYMASVPLYGYKYNRQTKKLEIDPEESRVVKLIFDLYQKPDSSLNEVTKKLNEMGYRCRKGGQWHETQVNRVLIHPGYCGKWPYTSGSERIVIDIPPIISEETFDKVQELSKKRKISGGGRKKYEYLVVDYLYCGICGRRMGVRGRTSTIRRRGKIYGPYLQEYYYCPSRTLKKSCGMKWISRDEIDSLVWREVKRYIKSPALIKQALKQHYKKDQKKLASLKGELTKIGSEIDKLELGKERIRRIYRKGIITRDQLNLQMQQATIERYNLDREKREVELHIKNQRYLRSRLNSLEKLIGKIQNNVDNLTFQRKGATINLLIDRIVIKEDGKIRLDMAIPGFSQTSPQRASRVQSTLNFFYSD